METPNLIHPGDRVKIRSGLFAKQVATVVDAFFPGVPDMPLEHCWLLVQTASFDGSKVFLHLTNEDVQTSDLGPA
jgi:hypothetical protein